MEFLPLDSEVGAIPTENRTLFFPAQNPKELMTIFFVFFALAFLLCAIPKMELIGIAMAVLLFAINPVFFVCCLPFPVAAFLCLKFLKRK